MFLNVLFYAPQKGKNIVMMLADNAFKYLSTQMYKIEE